MQWGEEGGHWSQILPEKKLCLGHLVRITLENKGSQVVLLPKAAKKLLTP